MHYIDEGEGAVVVCVHGNPTWSYYYRNLVKVLSRSHRVIALDHLGCGLSDKPQHYDYTLENHIHNMKDLLSHLGVLRYSLVMHDWGGAISMGLATSQPEKVERLVIMNTAAFCSQSMPFRIRLCRIPVVGEYLVRNLNGFAWPASFMAVKKKMAPEVVKAYLAPYNNWKNRIAIYRFVNDIPMRKGHKSYECLARIENGLSQFRQQGKVLLLWGGKDFCFHDHFYARWLEIFPEARHNYFPEAGHYLLEDAKEEANELIVSFLGGNVP